MIIISDEKEGKGKIFNLYVKNGDKKIFTPGFSSGFIRLKTADQVRIVGISKKEDKIPIEIPIGEKVKGVSIGDIDPNCLYMIPLSEQTGKCILQNTDNSGEVIDTIEYRTISCPVILDCDADRDGIVGYNEEGKANWTWDAEGRGAILMVNNYKSGESPYSQRSEYAELLVRSTGYSHDEWEELGLELRLYATPLAVKRFAVYRVKPDGKLEKVLPDDKAEKKGGESNISKVLSRSGERLLVEARQYPGQFPESHFEGLITIELHLRKKFENTPRGILLESDRVVFRVAPWIMIPNTRPVKTVYACKVTSMGGGQSNFLTDLSSACKEMKVPLVEVPEEGGDPWVQDQIEIGYSQGIKHHIPVVFNSPRKNGLKNSRGNTPPSYINDKLTGVDVGSIVMAGSNPGTLDSFGNLEVSPPVEVRGKKYPLGRIIFGGRSYGSLAPESREMMRKIRRFLYAQKVQSPIEVFTDWLEVGHVDEIICFIPNSSPPPPGEKDFKVLLASPARTHVLLKTLQAQKHGKKVMFKNRKYEDGTKNGITVDDLLNDDNFWKVNMVYQEHMNLNRAILAKHLDLQHNDFIEIPVIFEAWESLQKRTWAYFPNMVNHLVIVQTKIEEGSKKQVTVTTSIVPRPHGPNVDGKCAFEEAFRDSMPKKGHECIFIDDWYSYHIRQGGIHCGTNALRKPPLDVKWWHTLPDEGFNV